MQQTLLAIVAILVFSFFALNQHRAQASVERTAVGSEIEALAADVARARLVELTSLAYDEADVGRSDLRNNPSGLSTTLGPDGGETTASLYDDLDDYTGQIENHIAEWEGTDVPFTIVIFVRYVDPDRPSQTATSPTLAKEIVVTVQETGATAQGRQAAMSSLRQVVTPAWRTMHG